MSEAALRLSAVVRRYGGGDEAPLTVLDGAELSIDAGQMVALVAPSGAGKSTLLHIAGLLEAPSSGEVFIAGRPTSTMGDSERTAIRRRDIGFVYQFHHLLPEFSALENLVLPQMIAGLSSAEAKKRGMELLGYLGLAPRAAHRPAELSGGEQQRVAIARAVDQRAKTAAGGRADRQPRSEDRRRRVRHAARAGGRERRLRADRDA